MRAQWSLAAVSALVAIAIVKPVEAQRRRGLVDVSPSSDRHGAWFHFGVGAGDERFKFDGDNGWDTSSPTKPAFSLRFGGTLNPYLRLGAELTGWADTFVDTGGDEVTEYLGGLMLIGQFYPAPRLGFFVKGGAGLSRSGTSVSGGVGNHEDGFAWTAGLGYEIRLGRSIYLTPTIDLMQHRSESRNDPAALYDRLAVIGIGITVQPSRW